MKLRSDMIDVFNFMSAEMDKLIPELKQALAEQGVSFNSEINLKTQEILKEIEKQDDVPPFVVGMQLAEKAKLNSQKNQLVDEASLYTFAGVQLQRAREQDITVTSDVMNMINNPGVYLVGDSKTEGMSIIYSDSGKLIVMKTDKELEPTKFSKDLIIKGQIPFK